MTLLTGTRSAAPTPQLPAGVGKGEMPGSTEAQLMDAQAALIVSDLRKRYGPTVALDGLSLTVGRGEVHALLGENGTGKSTLVKSLSGLTRPDGGTTVIFGETVRIVSPGDARRYGIRTAFQEISLVKDLTVAENFLMMEEPVGFSGMIRKGRNGRDGRREPAGTRPRRHRHPRAGGQARLANPPEDRDRPRRQP